MTHHIALYGKSGVGKTTLAANISASMIEAGFSVVLVGCDLNGESNALLHSGLPVPGVMDVIKAKGTCTLDEIVFSGYKDIKSIELIGASSRKSSTAADVSFLLGKLKDMRVFEQLKPDYVIYDISGDTKCDTLQAVISQINIVRLFVVTTADYKALQAANDTFAFLEQHNSDKDTPLPMGGVILNSITSSFEEAFVSDFAYNTNARTIGKVPRSLVVRQSELYGQTVIEAKPLSNHSYYYRRLANQMVDAVGTLYSGNLPHPMSADRLRAWSMEWADRIYALENGLVSDGAAI